MLAQMQDDQMLKFPGYQLIKRIAPLQILALNQCEQSMILCSRPHQCSSTSTLAQQLSASLAEEQQFLKANQKLEESNRLQLFLFAKQFTLEHPAKRILYANLEIVKQLFCSLSHKDYFNRVAYEEIFQCCSC